MVTRERRVWSSTVTETLQSCFDDTHWNVLTDSAGSLEEIVDGVSEYIKFCVDSCVIPLKTKVYPNNKPWISKDPHALLKRKRTAFPKGDKSEFKGIRKEIDVQVKRSKLDYKRKLEQNFNGHNSRAAWQNIQTMIGYKGKSKHSADCKKDFVDELNAFYCRFDSDNFYNENNTTVQFLRIRFRTLMTPLL